KCLYQRKFADRSTKLPRDSKQFKNLSFSLSLSFHFPARFITFLFLFLFLFLSHRFESTSQLCCPLFGLILRLVAEKTNENLVISGFSFVLGDGKLKSNKVYFHAIGVLGVYSFLGLPLLCNDSVLVAEKIG
ncbi:hypothetical protein F2P56_008783, partial [Juglans regia]